MFRTFATVEVTAARTRRAPRNRSKTSGDCKVVYVDERKVAAVRAAAPREDAIARVAERFSALSDPTRVRILHALCREELCVCDLSKVAARSMPATSQQLQLLRRLGLVKFRMDGKLAYYSLADAWVREALETALDGDAEARR
jgi:ArsR family transcriptional regulator